MSPGVRPTFVVDTHPLAWYLTSPDSLSRLARQTLRDGEEGRAQLVIPHIVLAELYYVFRKQGQVDIFPATIAGLEVFCHFEANTLDDIRELPRFDVIREMHDRLIVILARRLNAPVITRDGVIRESGLVVCIW
jgi:PIN domain nuclease of toxin-antitoxin system